MRRSAPSRSPGERRQDFADFARDAKKEGGMCAFSLCTRLPKKTVPDGWTGRYGGNEVCMKHAKKLGWDPERELWDNTERESQRGRATIYTQSDVEDEDE